MAKVDFTQLANEIVEKVGGPENISAVTHCATRLRLVLKDESKADDEVTKAINGVLGVAHGAGQYQIIIGNRVSLAYEEMGKIPGIRLGGGEDVVEKDDLRKDSVLNKVIRSIAGCITPSIMAMCGAGMLKGILALLTALGVMSAESGTYIVLYAAADAVFRYLPIFIAYCAAEQFHCNKFIAVAIVCAMLYPTIAGMEAGTTFLGIPLTVTDYHQTALPPIIVVYAYSWLEKLLKKYVPDAAYQFVMPCVSLAVMVPLALLVVGPVFTLLGNALTAGYTAIYNISPLIPGIVIGGFWQLLVVFGVHMGFVPLMIQNLVTLGYDTMIPIIGPANFSIPGACLGVLLKTKKKDLKSVAGTSTVSGILGGITEPGIYGVCLPLRKPFYAAIIGGTVGGIITALAGTKAPAVVIPGLFTLPAFIGEGFVGMVIGMVASLVVSAVAAYFLYSDEQKA
ncbi:MAG: PTS transporter subunit EIIC [Erysipelotrichaceae bacterium]|nr:PTS transporter subunit EIIC [Erysipelotrichaceae bacterium]